MANTINDLYLKYVNKVGRTLEQDRYFQYLFEMVQAGNNVLSNQYQVLHKVVDEKWLSIIEESLDAINNIIDKPRRFVTTSEEVVPVALAKKITADSVRHLSMNTQFIASSEDGDIQPTRVLNVTTEESYDLYENRFIYHLIQRLVTFIDKRTDVIFWATGDETRNTLSYQSKVDDAYEEIEYKIEMTVKNRQSFAENDTDNMNVFMRIDRVRRMVMALRNSSFCDLMAGCSKVRSPIQRTNLIMKDPNYRTCYKLWQFLENYDDVGYTIEVQNSAIEFDEEYLFQMYTNLITNYTVFKSLIDTDSRRLEEAAAKKRRVIKPKFIKKVVEQVVDDYDIPDVEIKKVIIEEVTQAQLDAEAKLEEETKARMEAEEALEAMDDQMITLQQQVSNLMMQNQDAEIRAEQERIAKEDALRQFEQAAAERKAFEEQAAAELQATREQAAAELQETREQAAAERKAFEEQAAAELQETREQAAAELQATREQAAAELQSTQDRAAAELKSTKDQADHEIRMLRSQAEVAETRAIEAQAAAKEVQSKLDASNERIHSLKQSESKLEQQLVTSEDANKRLQKEFDEMLQKKEQELLAIRKEQEALAQRIQAERDELNQLLEQSRLREEELSRNLEAAEKSAADARAKAEANTLSHYLISAWNERKKRNTKDGDEE